MVTKSQSIFFSRQSFQTKAFQFSRQRLVNMYAISTPEDVKGNSNLLLYNSDGLKEWLNLGLEVSINGMTVMRNVLYVIVGTQVFKIDVYKNFTKIGDLAGSPGHMSLSNNGTQITATGQSGESYIITSSSVTKITDLDYELSVDNEFIDGYTIYPNLNGRKWFISKLFESSEINALDFESASWDPNNKLMRSVRFLDNLWIFGETSAGIYQNTGNPDFPFELVKGSLIGKGTIAKHSVQVDNKTMIWLGNDKIFYMSSGLQIQPISTSALNDNITSYGKVSDAFAFIYYEKGHRFYSITFPLENKTWAYDLDEKLWTEKESVDKNLKISRWRANAFSFFDGKNLFGDFERGIIWESDPEYYKDGDKPLIRTLTSKIISSDTNRFKIDKFRVDMDVGLGISEGQGEDPKIMMRLSKDGGRTYLPETHRTLGKQGEYRTRVLWRGLGLARQLLIELKISDPVPTRMYGFYIDYETLAP